MKKDDEESKKKKVFNHIKRIKENAVRRNRTRLSGPLATNLDSPTVSNSGQSNSGQPETANSRDPSAPPVATDQNQALGSPSGQVPSSSPSSTDQNQPGASGTQAPGSQAPGTQAPVVDQNASTPPTETKTDKATGESTASDDNNCSICLRENTNPALCNECFHCFCFPCIQQWSEQSNQCPVCRREYGLILYNIRSETEYDQLPVQPRRRVSEFEIILPFHDFFEMDDALTRFLQAPPLLPFIPPMQSPFLQANPTAALLPPSRLPARGRDPDNPENMFSLSVTNYNQPDAQGNRVVHHTLFIADPSGLDQGAQLTTPPSLNTPSSSLEQNQSRFREPLFSSNILQDPNLMAQRQPTMVFNPNYGAEPYRSLSNMDRYVLPGFSTLPPSTSTYTAGSSDGRPAMQTLDSIFERIFNDLTRFPMGGVGHPSLLARRSFPTNENSANSTQVDPTERRDSLEDPAEPADTASSTYSVIVRNPRPRRRGRGRRARGRGRARSGRRGGGRGRGRNSRSRNRSASRRDSSTDGSRGGSRGKKK